MLRCPCSSLVTTGTRQTDRQTDRQRGRDRETERERQRQRDTERVIGFERTVDHER